MFVTFSLNAPGVVTKLFVSLQVKGIFLNLANRKRKYLFEIFHLTAPGVVTSLFLRLMF